VHINVAKDGRKERDNADGNQKEAHISDACIVMACGGLRLLFWSKIVGAGGCARGGGAACCAVAAQIHQLPIRQQMELLLTNQKNTGYLL
jgi:hypothetical protein